MKKQGKQAKAMYMKGKKNILREWKGKEKELGNVQKRKSNQRC